MGVKLEDVMGVENESVLRRRLMIALKLSGALSWVGAYEIAHREARERGSALLHPSAIAFNIVWEAIYVAGGVYKWRELASEDRVQTSINAVWLVQDAQWIVELRRRGIALPPAAIALAFVYHLWHLSQRPPGDAARVSALWQNLAFSFAAAIEPPQVGPESRADRFTVARAFGTAVPTATSGILRGIRPRYLIPGLGCIMFDMIRIGRQRSARRV